MWGAVARWMNVACCRARCGVLSGTCAPPFRPALQAGGGKGGKALRSGAVWANQSAGKRYQSVGWQLSSGDKGEGGGGTTAHAAGTRLERTVCTARPQVQPHDVGKEGAVPGMRFQRPLFKAKRYLLSCVSGLVRSGDSSINIILGGSLCSCGPRDQVRETVRHHQYRPRMQPAQAISCRAKGPGSARAHHLLLTPPKSQNTSHVSGARRGHRGGADSSFESRARVRGAGGSPRTPAPSPARHRAAVLLVRTHFPPSPRREALRGPHHAAARTSPWRGGAAGEEGGRGAVEINR